MINCFCLRRVTLILLLFLCSKGVFPQLPFEIKGGKGYFADLCYFLDPVNNIDERLEYNPKFYGKINDGTATWLNVSYKTNTGFKIGLNFLNGQTSRYYNDPLGFYWNKKIYCVYELYGLNFAKSFRIKKHAISPGFGLSYRKFRDSYCLYDVRFTEDEADWVGEDMILYSYPAVNDRVFVDLGLELLFDYQFYFSDYVSLGVRLSTNIPFNFGIESVLVSPFISIDLGALK